MPVYADPKEIEKLALKLTRAAIACRDLGHNWRTRDVKTVAGGYERTFKCQRGCGTIRHQKLDRSARVKGNSYEYPQHGYLFDKPVGRIAGDAKAAIRLRAILLDLERIDGANSTVDLRQASGGASDRSPKASHRRGRTGSTRRRVS